MEIYISDDYIQLSQQMADDLTRLVSGIAHPVICTASGDSPAGLYMELVKRVQLKQLDLNDWYFVGLDEWTGMNGQDEGSCRYYLDQQLFLPLDIKEEKIYFFDGRYKDGIAECNRIEAFIEQQGGIDVAIVGLGLNGHVGMNEPGSSPELFAHISELDPLTIQVGQKYFKSQQELTTGITMGIADLMNARHVFLVVSGAHKAEIVQKIMKHEISERLPASFLRKHPSFYVYLDKQAASLIENSEHGS